MKKFLIILVSMSVIFLIGIFIWKHYQPSVINVENFTFINYQSKKFPVSFDIPKGWDVSEDEVSINVANPGAGKYFAPGIDLLIYKNRIVKGAAGVKRFSSTEEFIQERINITKKTTRNFKAEEIEIAGVKGTIISYTFDMFAAESTITFPLRESKLIFGYGNDVYTLNYRAEESIYPRFFPVFERARESFVFMKE